MGRHKSTDVELIHRLFAEDKSINDIIKITGYSDRTVKRYQPEESKRKPVDVGLIQKLYAEGKKPKQIAHITGISLRTVLQYNPPEHKRQIYGPHLPKHHRPGWDQREFPVHPEVVEAKEALIKSFMEGGNWGVPRARLAHLLDKHHPMDTRHREQMEHFRLEKLKKFVLST